MDREYWQQVEKIIDVALTLDEPEQSTYVEETCAGQEKLLKEVKQILQSIKASDDHQFLEMEDDGGRLFMNEFRQEFDKTEQQFLLGKEIGPWRITERIGSGGMGTVFKAERVDGAFHQTVAVKLIRFGAGSKEHLYRFKLEREILARLNHPNIAGIYDGGVTEEGLPYLVMQYVDGKPIDEWCDQKRCPIEERIKLFQKVCRAVEYAHNNLIVHRDLKPQNIYVTEEGDVKILDFGIAKLLDISRYEESRPQTRTGQWLGTPHYMSPEQIQGDPVTIASDIYSLGVLLHQLLCGTFPFDFSGKKIFETEQMIVTQDPVSPSRSVSSENLDIAHNRQFQNIGHLKKYLSGDLDAIVLQTLKKAPGERYGSTGRLLEDLQRYESGLTVSARPDSAWYRAKKFVRRQALPVSIAAAALILVTTGLSIAWLNNQARLAEAERSQSLSQFMLHMFDSVTPTERQGEEFTVTRLLEVGTDQALQELTDEPEVLRRVLLKIVDTHISLGDLERAQSTLDQVLDSTRSGSSGDFSAVEAVYQQARLHLLRGEGEQAVAAFRQALNQVRNHGPDDSNRRAEIQTGLARALRSTGNPQQAELLLHDSIDLFAQPPAADPRQAQDELATLYYDRGELAEARDMHLAVIESSAQWDKGRNSMILASNHHAAAFSFAQLGDIEAAFRHNSKALEIAEQLGGNAHLTYSDMLVFQAYVLHLLERHEQALAAAEQAIDNLAGGHRGSSAYRQALGQRADILKSMGRMEESIAGFTELIEVFQNSQDSDTERGLLITRLSLGHAQYLAGYFRESLETTDRNLEALGISTLPDDSRHRFNLYLRMQAQAVQNLVAMGRFEQATRRAEDTLRTHSESDDSDALQLQARFILALWHGAAYEQLGLAEKARGRFARAQQIETIVQPGVIAGERDRLETYQSTGSPLLPNTGETEIVQSENN